MSGWIEAGDLPWAAARIARKALERARTGSSPEGGESHSKALEVARRNIESTLGGNPDFPDLGSILRRHREYRSAPVPLPGTPGFRRAKCWPVDGREHLDAALEQGRGVILATAHLGWWLLVAPILRLHGVPVVQTGGPYFERKRAARAERAREQSRFRRYLDARTRPATYLGPEDLAITLDVRPIFRALSRNRPVLIAGDGKRSLEFAPFSLLGREYPLPIGFMKVAMAARCPILPVFGLEGDRCGVVRIAILPPLPVDPAANPVANVAEYARVLDDQLRRSPHLWTRWSVPDLFAKRRDWAANASSRREVPGLE